MPYPTMSCSILDEAMAVIAAGGCVRRTGRRRPGVPARPRTTRYRAGSKIAGPPGPKGHRPGHRRYQHRILLLTNSLAKQTASQRCGIRVAHRAPLEVGPTPENLRDLVAKRGRLGHQLDLKVTIDDR